MNVARFFILLCLFLCLSFVTNAQDLDMQHFRQIPVVHDGRVKPMGRMAQLTLQKITGDDVSLPDATDWLAKLIFDPSDAGEPVIFAVPDAGLRHHLGLPERKEPRYSFDELNAAMVTHADQLTTLRDKNPAKMSKDEAALFDLYATVIIYEQLKDAMTLVLPLRTENDTPTRLLDLSKDALAKPLYQSVLQKGSSNQMFLVIPHVAGNILQWNSPWMMYGTNTPLLQAWGDLADAYIRQDNAAWLSAGHTVYENSLAAAELEGLDLRLRTELFYLNSNPYLFSTVFYALGLVLLALRHTRFSTLAIGAGLGFHALGLTCRMIILQRPPVSDLYESLLFVGAIAVSVALIYGWRKQDRLALGASAVLGLLLHGAGFALSGNLGGGYDTLKVLQAVLDTRFWLATHVLIITSGYALCLLTSALAHYCLWHFPGGRKTRNRLYLLAIISLVFICTGTLLGGVWADQSWGRFWGWDPKENGALLIALWLIWLLHGKITRHISDFYFVMGMAALSLVVALSWIGINLLGVGLHSYGFLQGSATTLIILFLLEGSFFVYCWKRHA